MVGASSTVCITGIYTSLRQSRQLLSTQLKKKVRRDKTKQRSRLKIEREDKQTKLQQSHCRKYIKWFKGKRGGEGERKGRKEIGWGGLERG